jgi:hypothetical protein
LLLLQLEAELLLLTLLQQQIRQKNKTYKVEDKAWYKLYRAFFMLCHSDTKTLC